ncbi:PEP-CTERM sorting domain-containing protein [Floridanema evergladense]
MLTTLGLALSIFAQKVEAAADGLSLFVVHDKPKNGNGGSAKMRFDLMGDTASIKVVDDADSDQVQTLSGGTVFTSNHAWSPCCTDGLAIGSLENAWEMLVKFTAAPTGLNSWQAYSSSTLSTIPLAMQVGKRVRLDIVPPSPDPTSVPEPSSALSLLTISIFGATSLLKRKQQQKVLNSVVTD